MKHFALHALVLTLSFVTFECPEDALETIEKKYENDGDNALECEDEHWELEGRIQRHPSDSI